MCSDAKDDMSNPACQARVALTPSLEDQLPAALKLSAIVLGSAALPAVLAALPEGFLAGALGSGTGDFLTQLVSTNGEVDWAEVGFFFIAGGVTGGLMGMKPGLPGTAPKVLVNTVLGGAASAAWSDLSGNGVGSEKVNAESAFISGLCSLTGEHSTLGVLCSVFWGGVQGAADRP